ncbi:hypothetical protein N7495_009925 [Penicillium taxi]|uniref:uncharacterized protein n=1 Tax=Penicillium taxi TaxID=168475 RepID=UPI002545AB1F|nr:uncharacterized protein N7495_009925 [Penicillium taxi]KAJ5885415.1 hypothetical protein N7495_009925 [Penicillium taxi]
MEPHSGADLSQSYLSGVLASSPCSCKAPIEARRVYQSSFSPGTETPSGKRFDSDTDSLRLTQLIEPSEVNTRILGVHSLPPTIVAKILP